MDILTNFWQTYIDPELSLELQPAQTNVPGSHVKHQQSCGQETEKIAHQNREQRKAAKINAPKVYQVYSTPSDASTFTTICTNPSEGLVENSSSKTIKQVWINPSVKRHESFVQIPLPKDEVKKWTNTNFNPITPQAKRKEKESLISKKNKQNTNYNEPTPFNTKYVTSPNIKSTDDPMTVSKDWDMFANVCQVAYQKQSIHQRPYVIEDIKSKITRKHQIKDANSNIPESKYFEKLVHLKSEANNCLEETSLKLRRNPNRAQKLDPLERESFLSQSNTNEDYTISDLISPSELWIQEQKLNEDIKRLPNRGMHTASEEYPELVAEKLNQLLEHSRGTIKNSSINKTQQDNTTLKVYNLPPGTTQSEFQRLFPDALVTKPLEEDDLTSYDQLCYGYALFSTASQAREARRRSAGRSFRGHHLVIEFRKFE